MINYFLTITTSHANNILLEIVDYCQKIPQIYGKVDDSAHIVIKLNVYDSSVCCVHRVVYIYTKFLQVQLFIINGCCILRFTLTMCNYVQAICFICAIICLLHHHFYCLVAQQKYLHESNPDFYTWLVARNLPRKLSGMCGYF